MRLPQKKNPGDPVLAADWNMLLDAIAARTPRRGSGLELIASSGGFAYSRPAPGLVPRAGLPPFSVIAIQRDGGSFKVTVKEGWVIERMPKTGDHPAVKFHMPEAGGIALDSVPRPRVAMSTGDTLWCRFTTDTTGEITGTPEILAGSQNHDGVHYYPEDPDASGSAGEYFVKLFKLEDEGGSPRVKVYQQSDIGHWAQLWTGENTGGGARVFKEHDEEENLYKFRTIRGLGGITVTETALEIEIDSGTGGHLDLYAITLFCELEDGHIKPTGSSDSNLHRWRNGLYAGAFPVNSGPMPGDGNITVLVQNLTHLDLSP
jgi:hypothetical protein